MAITYEIATSQAHPHKFNLLRLPLATYHQGKNILILLYNLKPFSLFLLPSKKGVHKMT